MAERAETAGRIDPELRLALLAAAYSLRLSPDDAEAGSLLDEMVATARNVPAGPERRGRGPALVIAIGDLAAAWGGRDRPAQDFNAFAAARRDLAEAAERYCQGAAGAGR